MASVPMRQIPALLAFAPQSGSLADPAGSGAIVAAVGWLEGTLLGTLATSVAVIAVAWAGLLMLTGRLEVRRGLNVIVGCFIVFGAASIAAGIRGAAAAPAFAPVPPREPPQPPPPAPPPRPANPDPYAGASVPGR